MPRRTEIETEPIFTGNSSSRLPAQSRIGRFVNMHAKYLPEEWGAYLNNLGNLNHGRGNAVALGSMHMTYVSATEIGKMLSIKYPRAYDSPRSTLNLHRRLSKSFTEFSRSEQKDGLIDSPFGPIDPGEDVMGYQGSKEYRNDDRRFSYADMPCPEFNAFGNNAAKLALTPGDDDFFEYEMEACRRFLKSEELNTNYIDGVRTPHVTIFIGVGSVACLGLRTPADRPAVLPLLPPTMLTT